MKGFFHLLLGLSISLMVAPSCYPVLYSTNGQNVPMFKEKGEFSGTLGYASAIGESETSADGVSVQAAYAFSDKWAGLGSFYSMSNGRVTESEDWKSNGSYFEFGGGRYGVLKSGAFAWELYGGLGFCQIRNQTSTKQCNVNIVKPFIQPSFGYVTRYFDVAVTPRFGYVSYTDKELNLSEDPDILAAEDFFARQNNVFVFEPGITLRGGINSVKFQIQYNFSTFKAEYNNASGNFYPVNNEYASLGIYFLISKRYKGKAL